MDTCLYTKIGDHSEEQAALGVLHAGEHFSSQVLEAILNIALSVGYEGFEGSPVGTIFVVDTKGAEHKYDIIRGFIEVLRNEVSLLVVTKEPE